MHHSDTDGLSRFLPFFFFFEIIIRLLYDYNEYSYINSPWGPIELHRIFLIKALKTLE